jgi:tetratricopeptide (TPR) repeat protein
MLRLLTRCWRALFGGRGNAALNPPHADAALAARTDISRTYVERARALRARGLRREALATVAQATDLTPEYAQAWAEQGDDHLALGEREDARDCFELALAHAPDCVAARLGMSRMLRAAGDIAAAHAHILHALQIAPDAADLHFECALVMSRRGDVPGVITAYERVLELRPDDVAACSNLGLEYLSHSGDARRAQRCFERAVTLDPSCVAAQANLGLALEEQGDVAAAFAHYAKLIDAHPSESEYRWNRGLALLAGGDYARGWDDYELRNGRAGAAPRVFPFPPWQGAELPAGAALLIYGEQGVGDEIMFASCVPDLLARGMRIVIECDLRLAALYAR